ncbi:MAG: hypothetical protein RJA41_73 [Actinomycetota bacterium]
MNRVLTASWAEFIQLNAVWIITTVLTRDVVASFAVATGECDLRTDICTFFSHSATPSLVVRTHLAFCETCLLRN